jgi:hypothetical protein
MVRLLSSNLTAYGELVSRQKLKGPRSKRNVHHSRERLNQGLDRKLDPTCQLLSLLENHRRLHQDTSEIRKSSSRLPIREVRRGGLDLLEDV